MCALHTTSTNLESQQKQHGHDFPEGSCYQKGNTATGTQTQKRMLQLNIEHGQNTSWGNTELYFSVIRHSKRLENFIRVLASKTSVQKRHRFDSNSCATIVSVQITRGQLRRGLPRMNNPVHDIKKWRTKTYQRRVGHVKNGKESRGVRESCSPSSHCLFHIQAKPSCGNKSRRKS